MGPKENTPFSLQFTNRPVTHQISRVYNISCKAFYIHFNIIFHESFLVLNGVFQAKIQYFVPNNLVS